MGPGAKTSRIVRAVLLCLALSASSCKDSASTAETLPAEDSNFGASTSRVINVPGDFPTIQAAIDAASSDTIRIAAGVYPERLKGRGGISLVGEGPDKTVIRVKALDGPALNILGCSGVLVEGIGFEHTDPARWEPSSDKLHSLVRVDRKSRASIRHCAMTGAGNHGLVVVEASFARAFECRIEGARHQGVCVAGASRAEIEKCLLRHNRNSGVRFTGRSKGRMEDSVSEANGDGVTVDDAVPILRGNRCDGNERYGILFAGVSSGIAEGNRCSGNAWKGICVHGPAAEPVIKDNETSGPWRIHREEIHRLFERRQFAELESIADRLRRDKPRLDDGGWELDEFYSSFQDHAPWHGSVAARECIDKFRQWAKYKDKTTLATAVMATYRGFAWQARGSGYASSVTKEAWEDFSRHLEDAHKIAVASDADATAEADPEFYAQWIAIALGQERPQDVEDSFEKGFRVEPLYLPLYRTRVMTLLPRWSGSPGQLLAFAEHSADRTRQWAGEGLYAYVAGEIAPWEGYEYVLDDCGFSWPRMRQGFRDLLERYPDNPKILNRFARFACAADDRETARDLDRRIGERYLSLSFPRSSAVDRFERWASGDAPSLSHNPLHLAAAVDDVVALRKAIEAGADVNAVDMDGRTPLMRAAGNGSDHVIILLLASHADTSIRDDRHATALHHATQAASLEPARALIDARADLNPRDDKGDTPLCRAIVARRPDIATLLVKSSADPNIANFKGRAPLVMALASMQKDFAFFLISNGADPNQADNEGWSAIAYAVEQEDTNLCLQLIALGVDVNAPSKLFNGLTPMLRAMSNGRKDVAAVLMKAPGFDPNASNANGVRPLHIAARQGWGDIIDQLLAAGADPTLKDIKGSTPADYAERAGDLDMAKRLRDAPGPKSKPDKP